MDETSLPKDWDRLLQRLAKSLAHVEDTLHRTAFFDGNAPPTARSTAHEAALAAAAQQAEALDGKAKEVAQWVDAVDSELKVSEDLLRVLLNQTEAVRHKLATWATRAIG